MELTAYNVIVQLIGFGGLLGFFVSYQVKSNRSLFAAQTFGNAMFLLQFVLLQAYSGGLSLILGVVRNIILIFSGKKAWAAWKGWVVIFIIGYILVTIYTWNGWISLAPLAAMTACTIAYWTNNARNIRIANLFIACPAWIIYEIYYGAIAGIINESITMVSILISIYRFGWKNLGSAESGFDK